MTHHAYLLVGSQAWARSYVLERTNSESPDFSYTNYIKFGIDDARMLITQASRSPVEAEKRTFVLAVEALTGEAQNALLKLFEDPSDKAEFYLVVSDISVLLPTLLSRLYRVNETHAALSSEIIDEANKFRTQTYADRLAKVLSLTSDGEGSIESLLQGVEQTLSNENDVNGLAELLFVNTHIKGPGASKKMLLEHLALSLSRPK